jgi:hypothetical protein
MGGFPNQPMSPVENVSSGTVRMRPEVSHNRLNKGQQSRDETNDGMRIFIGGN